jgi:predicted ATPase
LAAPHDPAVPPSLAARHLPADRLNDPEQRFCDEPANHIMAGDMTVTVELTEGIILRAPHATVLATSREPLNVDGETVFPVRPLPVTWPKGGEEPNTFRDTGSPGGRQADGGGETATGGGAVELFARRAAAAVPWFTVTGANRGGVIRRCERLDGIPLAIEPAAVRLRTLSETPSLPPGKAARKAPGR